MIVVTGAAGFIASNLVKKLNSEGYKDIILVDDFSNLEKENNHNTVTYTKKVDRDIFIEWINSNYEHIQFIFHLGARTDTTEFDYAIFEKLNVNYSKDIWNKCCEFAIPLVYASSAATYGDGSLGYDDNHEIIDRLQPLNPYGESKNEFDKWALKQDKKPFFWAGLKFFNVYGPGESHKKRMASVVLHAHKQIKQNGIVKLFRSHNEKYNDGEQLRDFIYVKDIADVCVFLLENRKHSGIYNLGTGKAQTFKNLAEATFRALNKPVNIEYVDIPKDIRDKYQYFTEANMNKLRSIGYHKSFNNLEQGVSDYVTNYLESEL